MESEFVYLLSHMGGKNEGPEDSHEGKGDSPTKYLEPRNILQDPDFPPNHTASYEIPFQFHERVFGT